MATAAASLVSSASPSSPPDFNTIPAAPPRPGTVPNFVNPYSESPTFIGVLCMLTVLSTAFILVRLWTRIVILKSVTWSDYFLIAGWMATIVNGGLMIAAAAKFGYGRHMWDITLAMAMMDNKLFSISAIVYLVCMMLLKISIILFLVHVNPRRFYRYILCAIAAMVIASTVALILLYLLNCQPIGAVFNFTIPSKCALETSAFTILNGCINVITDVALLVLPIFLVRGLMLPTRQKVAVALILATGGLVCVISALRVVLIQSAASSNDLLYDSIRVAILSEAESHVSVMCACMPTLKPFLRRYAAKMLGDNSPSDSDTAANPSHVKVVEFDDKGNICMRTLNIDVTTPSRSKSATDDSERQDSTQTLDQR